MKYYTLLDLSSGYYQITMSKNSKRIRTDIINLLEFHSSIVFQRPVNIILSNLKYTAAMVQTNDITIPSQTIEKKK